MLLAGFSTSSSLFFIFIMDADSCPPAAPNSLFERHLHTFFLSLRLGSPFFVFLSRWNHSSFVVL